MNSDLSKSRICEDDYPVDDSPAGHRRRLRDRFLKGGILSLGDHELFELLLTYSIPRRDVKPLAKALLRRFGSVSSVFNASSEQLMALDGIGERSATLIKLIHSCHVKYFEERMLSCDPVANPEDVVNFSKAHIGGRAEENLMTVFVNSKNKVRGYEIISEGTVDVAVVYPRKIITKALDRNSNGIIIVHNHPSGDPEPSAEDISLTHSIKEAAKPMDIRVLDHIIVGSSGYFSFLDKGIL